MTPSILNTKSFQIQISKKKKKKNIEDIQNDQVVWVTLYIYYPRN